MVGAATPGALPGNRPRTRRRPRPRRPGLGGVDFADSCEVSPNSYAPITPFPTGRICISWRSRHFMPGYYHLVPSGQKAFLGPVHKIDSTSGQNLEDEDDDEYEDDCGSRTTLYHHPSASPNPPDGSSALNEHLCQAFRVGDHGIMSSL